MKKLLAILLAVTMLVTVGVFSLNARESYSFCGHSVGVSCGGFAEGSYNSSTTYYDAWGCSYTYPHSNMSTTAELWSEIDNQDYIQTGYYSGSTVYSPTHVYNSLAHAASKHSCGHSEF